MGGLRRKLEKRRAIRKARENSMRTFALSLAIIAPALPLLAASPAQAQLSRTWVSATGNDANNCSQASPCLTFSGALGKTVPGGEVNCFTSGDFGPVLISFAVTISCEPGSARAAVTHNNAARS